MKNRYAKIRAAALAAILMAPAFVLAEGEDTAITEVTTSVTETITAIGAQVVAVVIAGLAIWATFFVVGLIKRAARTGAK